MIAISARQAWYAAQRMNWQPLGNAKFICLFSLRERVFQAASTNRHHQIAKIMHA